MSFDILGALLGSTFTILKGRQVQKEAKKQAEAIERQARFNAEQQRKQTEAKKAELAARYIAMGFSLDGSAKAVLDEEERFGNAVADNYLTTASEEVDSTMRSARISALETQENLFQSGLKIIKNS